MRSAWWRPRYQGLKQDYDVEGVSLGECPVGYILPESRQLVATLARARFVPATALYGPSLVEWPARMVDAAVVIEQETNRAENARMRAEMRDDGE